MAQEGSSLCRHEESGLVGLKSTGYIVGVMKIAEGVRQENTCVNVCKDSARGVVIRGGELLR